MNVRLTRAKFLEHFANHGAVPGRCSGHMAPALGLPCSSPRPPSSGCPSLPGEGGARAPMCCPPVVRASLLVVSSTGAGGWAKRTSRPRGGACPRDSCSGRMSTARHRRGHVNARRLQVGRRCTRRLNPRRAQSVMLQYLPEPRSELPPATVPQLARRRRQIVVPQHRRRRAQRPERPLNARHQRLECLAQRQRHIRPAAVAQHPLEQQVRKRHTPNRDSQGARVREVERRFPGPAPPPARNTPRDPDRAAPATRALAAATSVAGPAQCGQDAAHRATRTASAPATAPPRRPPTEAPPPTATRPQTDPPASATSAAPSPPTARPRAASGAPSARPSPPRPRPPTPSSPPSASLVIAAPARR